MCTELSMLTTQPGPLEETSTGTHSTLPHAVKYTVETQAIVSINMDIHQLCLYILGGAGSRGGNCIFHPRTFSCHCPSRLWFPRRGAAAAGSAPLHSRACCSNICGNPSRNVMSAVCTAPTAGAHTGTFFLRSDGDALPSQCPEKRARCFHSIAF